MDIFGRHGQAQCSHNLLIDTALLNPPCESQLIQQPLVFTEHRLLIGFTLHLLSLHLQIQLLILLLEKNPVLRHFKIFKYSKHKREKKEIKQKKERENYKLCN